MYQFKIAQAVWGENLQNKYNQFLGFYTEFETKGNEKIMFAIAARSYYRLYINGEMAASGPARAAKHHCRVDNIEITVSGKVKAAIEVAALDKLEKYCNDCTLEPGMLAAEIIGEAGEIIAATGDKGFKYTELAYRRSMVETMSHSRGIVEMYDLSPQSFDWRFGGGERWKEPVKLCENIKYLERRAPYAGYREIKADTIADICDMVSVEGEGPGFVLSLSRSFNPKWYSIIPKENLFLESLRNEKDNPFSGTLHRNCKTGGISITPGSYPTAITFCIQKSELGFIDFNIATKKECVIDIINSDHKNINGILKSNSYVTRYHLKSGKYHLTTFEPKLTRYIKMILRTEGEIELTAPKLLDYSFPDDNSCYFECNDGELNMIYDGARRTQRLNSLDIFMDCPQRERGGWLCDSYFAAQGAAQMLGDNNIEHDFMENFMLTNPDVMWNSFFPEVYPGSKADESDPGFKNWSFWLLAELAEYYERTNDTIFIEQCRERVRRFIEGMLSLRGESGLLEKLDKQFVDWSLSNRDFCTQPISIPNNCLAVYILEKMSDLYNVPMWKNVSDEMRTIIEQMDDEPGIFGGGGDGAVFKDGKLSRTDCLTESGIALELWSGFHKNDKRYIERFIKTMGTCPVYRQDPNVGRANLFIGLMIRFDVLARMGEIDTLVKEWKDLYLPQLRDGSGTFFENYAALSGCHGFNGVTGALIMSKVLGLGEPIQRTKTVVINPHPGALNWASGCVKCKDGVIFLGWSAKQSEHILDMRLQLPKGWGYKLLVPFELKSWTIILNGEKQRNG